MLTSYCKFDHTTILDYSKVKCVTSAKLEEANKHSNPSKLPCKANNMIKQLWDLRCQPQII